MAAFLSVMVAARPAASGEFADKEEAVPITLESTPASEDWECAYVIEFRNSQSMSERETEEACNSITGMALEYLPRPPA